jgi:hypothetical protein
MKIVSAEIASQASRQYESSFNFTATKTKADDVSADTLVFGDTLSALMGEGANGIGGGTDIFAELWDSTIGRSDSAQTDGLFCDYSQDSLPVSQNQSDLMSAIMQLLQERFSFLLDDTSASQALATDDTASLGSLAGLNGYSSKPRFALQIESGSYEYEKTSFSSSGSVLTADGKEYSFNVNLEMERAQSEYIKKAIYLDPLVINYGGTAAQLEAESFSFDLDADGELDNLARLGSGSGFLALDKNADGEINDGTELFGSATGNGFGELAAYDADGNGWIDENDDIFNKLSIWARDDSGEQVLCSLKDKDVGAIFLGSEDTEFSVVRNSENLGVIRQTGVALTEAGQAVTVQQIDLSLRAKETSTEVKTGEIYKMSQKQTA